MDADKKFWMTIRAALIMFVRAIEERYNIKEQTFIDVVKLK